ncbi:MAG: phosphotransferase [Pseudomonadota bacterium]
MQLIGVALKGVGTLLRDWLGELIGRSLPFRPEQVLLPDTLNRLLNDGALPTWQGPADIRGVVLQDVPSVSSNCQNLILSIQQSEPASLPASLFVKVPMESLATRWFFTVINSWQLESYFFRHVAPTLPLRLPRTYATAYRGGRFYLVQENLHEDVEVSLFTNLDMIQGPSIEKVRGCLDTLACLHATHYGLTESEQDHLLPRSMHLFLSPTMGRTARSLNRMALKPCMARCPGVIPENVRLDYLRTMSHWDDLLHHWFSGPLSLLHGDSHLGNFFVSGTETGMLDWQAAHWGKGVRDVQYFLINSLPADFLADNEQELVSYYVSRCSHYGVAVDFEETWEQYRGFTFHTLMTIVVSIGFGALNEEQDQLMAEILRRAIAAIGRVDYHDWLDDLLSK